MSGVEITINSVYNFKNFHVINGVTVIINVFTLSSDIDVTSGELYCSFQILF